MPFDGCSFPDPAYGAFVMNMETRSRRFIAYGNGIDWVDDRTLLIEARPPKR